MAAFRIRPSAVATAAILLLILASASPKATAFDRVDFSWPTTGSFKLDIAGTSDITFAETVNFTTKADITLALTLGKWRHNLTMSYVLKNGNLPEKDLIKVGELGLYLDRWRLVSMYDKLTITAGDTAAPNVLTKYMLSSSLYGATVQLSAGLSGSLKDISYGISAMGGKNSTSRGISSTTLDVAGLGLELQYKKDFKMSLAFVEGIKQGTDANVASTSMSYIFPTGSLVFDGALSLERISGSKGWLASLTYSDLYSGKARLVSNITYSSSGFSKVSPIGPSTGGTIAASANLNLTLAPIWKGSEALAFRAKFSKDNIEGIKASSVQAFEGGLIYSASGFAPSTTASVGYTFQSSANDLEPKTVNSVKHQLDLKYSNQQMIDKSRLTVSIALTPSVSINKVTDDLGLAMTSSASASLFMVGTTITGKAEMKTSGNRVSKNITINPSLELGFNTNIVKPAITIAATVKVSNSSTLKYSTGTVTSDVSYLDIAPSVIWKATNTFSVYAKYAGKLRFGTLIPKPTWTDTFSMGVTFRL